MKFYCKDCRKELLTHNINIQNFIAKCHHCDSVFHLDNDLQNDTVQSEILDIPCPKDINVIRNSHELVMELKDTPFFIYYFVLIGFAIGGTYSFSFFNVLKMYYLHTIFVGILLFFLIHILLKKYASTITIRVNSQETSVDYGALSFRGKKVFSSPNFKQLYCQEFQQTSSEDRRITYYYKINIITQEGTQETLMSSIYNPEKALFIEREIEKYLNIADKNVPDAYK